MDAADSGRRWFSFRPRLWSDLRGYRRDDFAADLASGVTVALVALPLAIAFGIASGVRPDQGIVTAIVGGLIVSILGGSRVQIAGPAGAFVALLYAIVDRYGVANLLIATMMAGILLFAMGALRLGTLVRFIPVSIVIGFSTVRPRRSRTCESAMIAAMPVVNPITIETGMNRISVPSRSAPIAKSSTPAIMVAMSRLATP